MLSIRHHAIAAFALAITLSSAFGIVERDDVLPAAYTDLANQPQFAAVGRIDFDYGDGNGYQGAGSATLISSNCILTAGHMLDSTALEGVVGIHFVLGAFTYTISLTDPDSIAINPGYDPDTLANDLSIAFLTTSSNVTPAALFSSISLRGLTTTIVGYGATGTGLSGSTTYDGIKRAGTNTIDIVTSRYFEVDFDNPAGTTNTLGSSTALAMEALTGPGDSGGSAWAQINGVWGIVGVTSFGIDSNSSNPEGGYGDIGGFVNVQNYLPWIESVTSITIVPEPSEWTLVGLGLCVLALRKRT